MAPLAWSVAFSSRSESRATKCARKSSALRFNVRSPAEFVRGGPPGRRTEPLQTLHGVVDNYADIEELLSDAEMRGRRWVFDRAQSGEHGGSTPTDHDILDLHRFMFSEFLDWAGGAQSLGRLFVHEHVDPKSDTLWDQTPKLRDARWRAIERSSCLDDRIPVASIRKLGNVGRTLERHTGRGDERDDVRARARYVGSVFRVGWERMSHIRDRASRPPSNTNG
jgi:hypothetical protein